MTNSALRHELISEGIEVPSSIFDWSISSNGMDNDASLRPEDGGAMQDVLSALQEQLRCEEKLRLVSGAHLEMLKKQNAALAAGLSAVLKPEKMENYRSTLRRLLTRSKIPKPYASADNERYSTFIDSAFNRHSGDDFAESLFSELAEFELRLKEQYDEKLQTLRNEVSEVESRHAEALRREAQTNDELLKTERERKIAELKKGYRVQLDALSQSLSEQHAQSAEDRQTADAEWHSQRRRQLSETRCRVEAQYTAAVGELTGELQHKEQAFAEEQLQLSSELRVLHDCNDLFSVGARKIFMYIF
jgi:hypothetical protein